MFSPSMCDIQSYCFKSVVVVENCVLSSLLRQNLAIDFAHKAPATTPARSATKSFHEACPDDTNKSLTSFKTPTKSDIVHEKYKILLFLSLRNNNASFRLVTQHRSIKKDRKTTKAQNKKCCNLSTPSHSSAIIIKHLHSYTIKWECPRWAGETEPLKWKLPALSNKIPYLDSLFLPTRPDVTLIR